MKSYFLLIFIFWASISNAQKITENMKVGFETNTASLILSELKSNQVSINECFGVNDKSYSLLTIAIKLDKMDVLKALIQEKADVNKICEDKSPLMYAVKYGRLDMVKLLVGAGATINLKNSEGKTALDYAIKYQQKEIEEYLTHKK